MTTAPPPKTGKVEKITRRHLLLSGFVAIWVGTVLAPMVMSPETIHIIIITVLVGILIVENLREPASRWLKSDALLTGSELEDRREAPAEDADVAKFKSELNAGPSHASATAIDGAIPSVPAGVAEIKVATAAEGSQDALKAFYAWAPEATGTLDKLVEACSQLESQAARHNALAEIRERVVEIKHRSSFPELQPAWQLATALEGLLKQLTSRADNINHSTLRTIAGGTTLLADLCVPGVRTDLATQPAIKILAVDDDPVSRFALSSSVRKVFDRPDIAENGKLGLERAKERRYDLIILDVMMPDIDGFELCGRLRQDGQNGSTPVLFVTALKDFDSRSRSLSSGGGDLMGKPFITFEVAVKALTLVLRDRLRGQEKTGTAKEGSGVVTTQAVRWPQAKPNNRKDEPAATAAPVEEVSISAEQAGSEPTALMPPAPFVVSPEDPGTRTFAPVFLAYMEVFNREVQLQIKRIGEVKDEATRKEILERLHLRLAPLTQRLGDPELRPAHELCSAVKSLCCKLKDSPGKMTPSALRTAAAGLEMLQRLCAPGVRRDLVDNPPMRILVVDDEPLARRALVGALQMSFPKPDGAESGEMALQLAANKEFDVAFLDVFMPEMDGFEACQRLHETNANRATPVVFVTSYSDEEFRMKARDCGARDFVVKPFDYLEIPVKALTFALGSRLEKMKTTEAQSARRADPSTI